MSGEEAMSAWAIEQAGFSSGAVGYSSGQLGGVAVGVEEIESVFGAGAVREAAQVTPSVVSPAEKASSVAGFLDRLWNAPGVTGSIIRVSLVAGTIAIAYEGVNYFFDQKRAQALYTILNDPSVPEDLRRQALSKYIDNYSKPPSLFEQFGTLILIGGGAAAGLLALNWYLKRHP